MRSMRGWTNLFGPIHLAIYIRHVSTLLLGRKKWPTPRHTPTLAGRKQHRWRERVQSTYLSPVLFSSYQPHLSPRKPLRLARRDELGLVAVAAVFAAGGPQPRSSRPRSFRSRRPRRSSGLRRMPRRIRSRKHPGDGWREQLSRLEATSGGGACSTQAPESIRCPGCAHSPRSPSWQ